MKKIVHNVDVITFYGFSTEYIIIEEDGQHISDKYVDFHGDVMRLHYALSKGDIIIRKLYQIDFNIYDITIIIRKYNNYQYYPGGNRDSKYHTSYSAIKKNLDTITSLVSPQKRYESVVDIFSKEIEIRTN